jgi:hypothetical protein
MFDQRELNIQIVLAEGDSCGTNKSPFWRTYGSLISELTRIDP